MDDEQQGSLSTAKELLELRSEVSKSLELFHSHVKYTITLMTTVIALAFAMPAFSLKERPLWLPYFLLSSSACFLLSSLIAYWSVRLCRRYYVIYASNYIYAARVYQEVDPAAKHPWLNDLYFKQGFTAESLMARGALDHFIEGNESKDPNSWRYYRKIIVTLLVFSVVFCVLFFAIASFLIANSLLLSKLLSTL